MTAFEKLFPGASNLGVGIELTASNQNKTNLTHDVDWKVYIYTTNTVNNWTNPESETVVTAKLDEDSIYSVTNANFNLGYKKGKVTFASGTKTVKHNSNGKKSVSFSVYMDPKFQPWNVSGTTLTGSFDLPDISVAAPPPKYNASTISSYPTRVRVGQRVTVDIKSGGSGYYQDLWMSAGGQSQSVGTRTGSGSISFYVPSTYTNKIGTKSSISGIFMVFSYTSKNGTRIGTNSKSITILPPLTPPTVTGSEISDANTYASKVFTSGNQFLNAFSNIKAKVTGAAGVSGATITQYEVILKNSNGTTRMSNTSSSSTVNLGVPNYLTSGSETLDVFTRVKDSNGNWSSQVKQSKLLRVHAYSAPSGTGAVARTTGTSAKVDYNWSASSLKQGGSTEVNSVSIQVQSKPRGGSYSTKSTYKATSFSGSRSVTLSGYTTTQSYDFRLYIYDGVTGVYVNINALGTEGVPLDLVKKGAGIGKIHSGSGANLQVGSAGIDSEGKITENGISISEGRHLNYKTFTVGGNANSYYPVVIAGQATFGFHRYSISRGYNWAAPNTWNTSTHRGGLTLDIEWSGDVAWGGNDKAIRVIEWNETYTTIAGGLGLARSGGLVVWLRGGGAQYRLRSERGQYASHTVYLNDFTDASGAVFPVRTSPVASEINNRYPVRGSGTLYDSGNKLWHAGNDGSGSGLDADLLDGKHASSFWSSSNHGSGSGLDADKLDGKHASSFANFSYTKDGIFEIYRIGNMMIITGQKGSDTTVSEWTRDGTITYPTAFTEFPRLSLTVTTFSTRDKATPYIYTSRKTGFDFTVWDSPLKGTRTVHFIAIGKV